jgi:hypothetical protein
MRRLEKKKLPAQRYITKSGASNSTNGSKGIKRDGRKS